MSADLWAEFGSNSNPQHQVSEPADFKQHGKGTSHPGEEASFVNKHDDRRPSHDEKWETDSWAAVNDEIEQAWLNTGARNHIPQSTQSGLPVILSTPNVPEDDEFGDFEEPDTFENARIVSLQQQPPPSSLAARAGPVVEDEDEFGDFEDVEPQVPTADGVSNINDKGIVYIRRQNESTPRSRGEAPTIQDPASLIDFSTSTLTANNLTSVENAQKTSLKPQKIIKKEQPVLVAASDSENDDDWDDFGASTSSDRHIATSKAGKYSNVSNSVKIAKIAKNVVTEKAGKSTHTTGMPPPSNIPPPSVLMTLICGLLSELPEQIRVSIVETWEEDEADIKKHVETLQVTAHIMAGRKLRWKRDKNLAQSMRIGTSGRQGGMKLAGVDRAEMQREEREVVELLRVWRANLGLIRAAVSEASSNTAAKPAPLPVISENIPIRTAKPEEGGIAEPKCCVLCGLKRDERAAKVDADVWDQFGEWWIEHWGHSSCKRFWEEHEFGLQQR